MRVDFAVDIGSGLARSAVLAILVKVVAAVATLGFYVGVARSMNPNDAGVFLYGITIVAVLSILGRLGLDQTLVRFIAISLQNRTGEAPSLLRNASFIAIAASLSLVMIFGVTISSGHLRGFDVAIASGQSYPLVLSAVPVALVGVHSYVLFGLQRPTEATFFLNAAIPFAAVAIVLPCSALFGLTGASYGYFASTILAMIASRLAVSQYVQRQSHGSVSVPISRMLAVSIPLFSVALSQQVISWGGVLVAGAVASAKEVAWLTTASRVAALLSFSLVAVGAVVSPRFAELHSAGQVQQLEKLARRIVRLLTVCVLPFFIAIMWYPEKILGVFGPSYEQGAPLLRVLAIGELVNVITGPAGLLLIMCGHEKMLRNIVAFSAIFGLTLYALFAQTNGVTGVAYIMALTIIVQNVLAMLYVSSRLGIRVWSSHVRHHREQ